MGRGKAIVFTDAYSAPEKHARNASTGKPRPRALDKSKTKRRAK